jgi:hypothetical protein
MNKPKDSATPATCSFKELFRLRTDSVDAKPFWLSCDTYTVAIHEQLNGHESTQSISIPRPIFNRLIRWYLRPQKFVRKAIR